MIEKLFNSDEIEQYYRGYRVAKERKPGLPETITPIFYGSVPYHGEECETFAYLAVPQRVADEKFPAVVLVHGGNGKAEHEWAQLWAERGYVAIAMDINKQMYTQAGGDFTENPIGGPKGYGSFDQMDGDIKDTWAYHSAANAVLAKKLLESLDFVDSDKIGIAGISWGGFITYLTVGNCSGFAFCCVSYTSGYLFEDVSWRKGGLRETMGQDNYKKWVERLDPSVYIPLIDTPTLLIRGADDVCFESRLWKKTVQLFSISPVLSLHKSMTHDQESGANQREIFAFADGIVKGAPLLISDFFSVAVRGDTLCCSLKVPERVENIFLVFTESKEMDSYSWKWESEELKFSPDQEVSANIPLQAQHYYILVRDTDGNLLSSNIFDR